MANDNGEALCHADRNSDRGLSLADDRGDDDAYSRAQRDPAFLGAVREAYAGHRDVLDALWWMSHPAEAAPDGAPSPQGRLRELQHRVFSANGGSAGDPEAALAIRELQAEISAERDAIAAAVRLAHQGRGRQHLGPSVPPGAPGVASTAEATTAEATTAEGRTPEGTATPTAERTRNLLVIAGIVAALGAGFIAGIQMGAARVDAAPTPVPTAEETCGQMSDVATILLNAQNSFLEDRSTEQEYQGAAWLAARTLDRVDTAPGTRLAKRIDALRLLVSSGTARTQGQELDTLGAEWGDAFNGVGEACAAAGSEVGVESWTGG